ncbi:MAG: glycerophosphodiester phosphodiesterase family protein [Pseudomonadota bacterium]
MPDLPEALLHRPIAHRGLHNAEEGTIENTRAAVEAAIGTGYAIEIDVQAAACGTPMVVHDPTLERLTDCSAAVAALTAEELALIQPTGTTEGIPTLREILGQIAGRSALLIEIKPQESAGATAALTAATARLTADAGLEAALMSFDPNAVRTAAAVAPALPRGLVTRGARVADLATHGASFLALHHRALDQPGLADVNIPILTWTIRSATEEAQARRIARNVIFEGYLAAVPELA